MRTNAFTFWQREFVLMQSVEFLCILQDILYNTPVYNVVYPIGNAF